MQDLIAKSEATLKSGYSKLTGYKTTEKGYEWFGESPASEVLSAYGLLQFLEMQMATADIVEQSMIDDLIAWIESRLDGLGGFLQNPLALDTFGKAPKNTTDAYIVWALTSTP